MSNAHGIDSVARTARLHPKTLHYIPFVKGNRVCDCGGYPQPLSSKEMSETTRVVYDALRRHGDSFWTSEDCTPGHIDCGSNIHLFEDILSAVKLLGYDLKIVKRT